MIDLWMYLQIIIFFWCSAIIELDKYLKNSYIYLEIIKSKPMALNQEKKKERKRQSIKWLTKGNPIKS